MCTICSWCVRVSCARTNQGDASKLSTSAMMGLMMRFSSDASSANSRVLSTKNSTTDPKIMLQGVVAFILSGSAS